MVGLQSCKMGSADEKALTFFFPGKIYKKNLEETDTHKLLLFLVIFKYIIHLFLNHF